MARKSRKNIYETASMQANTPKNYNAAAYVRLSCDDKKKRGDSLETQQKIIEDFAAVNPGIRIAGVYSDNNMTGRNFERPGFKQMMDDAERGIIDCIIVKDLTRFGRNAIDCGYYLEKRLPVLGVRFIAVTDSYDSLEPDNGFLVTIKNIIGESYALDIGRRVKAVHRQNIADGRFVGRIAPYGYMKSPDDCHKLIIDAGSAEVVRQIFSYAADGRSVSEITKMLNESGVPSPMKRINDCGYTKVKPSTGDYYWQPNTVRKMLADRVYLGDMVQGKTRTVNGRQLNIDASEWVCVPDTHEPVIGRELFEYVQMLRQAVADKVKSLEIMPFSPNLFKSKVICDRCGRPLNRKRQNKDGTYWFRCNTQVKYGKSACCVVSVKETEIFDAILAALREQSGDTAGKHINSKADDDGAIKEIHNGITKNKYIIKTLYENLVKGVITQDDFTSLKASYDTRNTELSAQADELRSNSYRAVQRVSEYGSYMDAALDTLHRKQFTQEAVDALVDRIVVYSDKSFDVLYRIDCMMKEDC